MTMKLHAELIFIRMVSHLNSGWNRGRRELVNGLLPVPLPMTNPSHLVQCQLSFSRWFWVPGFPFFICLQVSFNLLHNLCCLTCFKHCVDFACCKLCHCFGPRKHLLELIASCDKFSLGAVILPSSVAWLEISLGPCRFEFVVVVYVTR